jgi:hypothetical protein
MYLLENNQYLNDSYASMFELFRNIIMQKYFQYLNDSLLVLLTRYILNFSFQMTNSFQSQYNTNNGPDMNAGSTTTTPTTATTITHRHLSLQHQLEIKSCVELIDQLVDNLTMIACINHVVLCLCELLDLTWQFQLNKSDGYKLTRTDNAKIEINDEIIKHIYQV